MANSPKTCVQSTQNEYYPNHLTHGLLAAHCATVKGHSVDDAINDPQVKFCEDNHLFQDFRKTHNVNINEYLCDWKIRKILDVTETGYLGIIYVNERFKHVVVSHRSTNLELSLKFDNLLSKSSLHQDIEGVLIGNVTLHQANGYLITAKAIDLIHTTHQDYSLSFAGHSLGAWLAQLSVLYCHDSFNFVDCRAVTFDGPGSAEMMERLRSGDIKGTLSSNKCKLEDLDIISYLTAPNVVNCANKHVGTVYRIFPDNAKVALAKKLPEWCVNIDFLKSVDLLTLGHSLKYILPYFSPASGKPTYFQQVEKWPSIVYSSYSKYSACNLVTTSILKSIRSHFLKVPKEMSMSDTGISIGGDKVVFHWNQTTLDSIAHLALIFCKGKIDLQQFWLVHKYLNKDCGFVENPQNQTEDFFLEYKAQYKVSDVDPWSRKKTGDKIDKCLSALEANRNNAQGEYLRRIVDKYHYDKFNKLFVVDDTYRKGGMTMELIRDMVRSLCRKNPDFEIYVRNISKTRLPGNIGHISIPVSFESDKLDNIFSKGYRLVILKGMTGGGKTTLAKSYAKKYERDFTTILLTANSKIALEKSLNECAKSLPLKLEFVRAETFVLIKDHLDTTKQQMLFILDDVKEFACIAKFLQVSNSLKNVKFIITTQNDQLLVGDRDIPQIQTEYFPTGEKKAFLQAKIKNYLETLIKESKPTERSDILDVIRFMAYFKPGSMSIRELIHCLEIQNKTIVFRTLEYLKSISFLTTDANSVNTNELVQEAAIDFAHNFAVDFFQQISAFSSNNLLINGISSILRKFDLAKEYDKIIQLESTLNIEKKCNLLDTVSRLLDDAYSNNIENYEVLQRLNKHFIGPIDSKLQSLVTTLTDGWTASQKQGSQKDFINNNKSIINQLLETFSNFQTRVQQECSKQKLGGNFENCKHVFVIGPTGSGKSTIINYLVGNTLECVQVGRNGTETKINVGPAEGCNVAVIGNSFNSETNSIRPYYNKGENVVYWDFPGFFDTRGDIQKLQHAFLLKSFSESLVNSKLLLVVESSLISAIRGETFVNLVSKLSQLCSIEKIQNGISLLVTKCDPFDSPEERDKDKADFLKAFSKILDNRREGLPSGFLKLLKTDNMSRKLALLPKVTKRGPLVRDFFEDLEGAIGASNFQNIVFGLNIDDDTILKIVYLSDLLNKYAGYITQEAVNDKVREVKFQILKDTFTKDKLLGIKKFPLAEKEITFGSFIREATGDKVKSHFLTKIYSTLTFFKFLNCNSFPGVETWCAPFAKFNNSYEQLIRPATLDLNEAHVMKIEAPILSASDIQKFYDNSNGEIRLIKASALLFIVDKDIDLPGMHLAVSGEKWKIIGNREIRLAGVSSSQEATDSGNFYGYAKKAHGGILTFVLDGVDGENGEFDPSKCEQLNICKNKIQQIKYQIGAIEKLKSFRSCSLANEKENQKNEIQNCKQTIRELKDKLQNMTKRANSNPSRAKGADLKARQQLENTMAVENGKLQDNQQDLVVVEILICMTNIHKNCGAVPRKYSSLKRMPTIDRMGIANEIGKIYKETSEIVDGMTKLRTREGEDQGKFKELSNILGKAKDIHCFLKRINQDQDYCKWQKDIADADRRLAEKHQIPINGILLELSPNELHDLLSQRNSGIEEHLEKELKVETAKLKDYSKQIKDTKGHIKRFNNQNRLRRGCKIERDKKYQVMVDLREKLRNSSLSEFSILDQKIEDVRKATMMKEEMSKYFDEIVGKMDNTPEDSGSKVNRELLRSISKREFAKDFKKQLSNLETQHSQKKCDKLIAVLKEHAEVKTNLELFQIKQYINTLVDRYDLSKGYRFPIVDSEGTLMSELGNVRKRLKKLCSECEIFSQYIKSNVLTDSELDDAIEMQYEELENLQKKLECADLHKKIISDALEKLTSAHEGYKIAKKEYDKWKQGHQLGKTLKVDNFLEIYEDFVAVDEKWRISFETEAKLAEELLRKGSNLISRKERKWSERNSLGAKTTHVLKELFVFTRQYYEKYAISGSEGSPGTNSGAFVFQGDRTHVGKISCNPGKGGQHASVLEGTYANEYSFPFLRQIRQKLNNEKVNNANQITAVVTNTLGVTRMVDDLIGLIITSANTTAFSTARIISISGYVITAISVLASPVVATMWSHWVDGPYKYDRNTATSGEQANMDKDMINAFETEFSLFLQDKSQHDLALLIFNNSK